MTVTFTAEVITVSTRAAAGAYEDTAGPTVCKALRDLNFAVDAPLVVADGDPLRAALTDVIATGRAALVITCGGTGLSPTDETPQITKTLIDYEVPGLAELVRASSWDRVPAAALSRGIAGVAGSTLVINVPGSRGGASDAIAALAPVLTHALDQLAGRDH